MRDLITARHKLPELTTLPLAVSDDRPRLSQSMVRRSSRRKAKAISSYVSCVLSESKAALADQVNQNEAMSAKYQEITGLAEEILVLVDILFAEFNVPRISPGVALTDDQPLVLPN